MPDDQSYQSLLLTGASGFLGGEIARQCIEQGRQIRCIGRRPDVRWPDYHQVDLVKDTIAPGLFAGIKTVIHCAGLAHQFGSAGDNAELFFQTNRDAVEKLTSVAAANGVEHFILISSSGVYGPSDHLRDEESECHPVGPYSKSKLAGEYAAIEVAKSTDMRLTIARMTTLYGEGDRGNVNRLINAISRKRFIQIGKGENRKNLFNVTDAARACLTLADAENSGNQINIYNVGTQAVPVKNLIQAITAALKVKPPIYLPAALVTNCSNAASLLCLHKGPLNRIHKTIMKWLSNDEFSVTKFEKAFSFTPQINLQQGVSNQVASTIKFNQSQTAPLTYRTKRLLDFILSFFALCVFILPLGIIAALVKLTSKGPVLYVSDRVGKENQLFPMAKFRTMRTDTPEVATHLLGDSKSWITPLGKFLRKTSLDELPQLFNILKGEMSLVGPRPALHNQDDLIELRTRLDVHRLTPGITGLAQVSGRDELLICEKVEFDRQYLFQQSLLTDIRLIFKTALAVVAKKGVKQADEESQVNHTVISFFPECELSLLATPRTLTSAALAANTMIGDAHVVCVRDEADITSEFVQRVSNHAKRIVVVLREPIADQTASGQSWARLEAEMSQLELIQLPAHSDINSRECLAADQQAIQARLNWDESP